MSARRIGCGAPGFIASDRMVRGPRRNGGRVHRRPQERENDVRRIDRNRRRGDVSSMRPLIALICALPLAACAADSSRQVPTLQLPLSAEPRPEVAAQPRLRPPLPEPRPKMERSATSVESGPQKSAAVRALDVDALSGADRASLRTILGPADEVRGQPPGEVWIYRVPGCSVELYLFPQLSASQFAVLGHKVLPSSLADEERTACLTKLASRARAS